MEVVVMLIFLAVWLLIFWLGSIALETTGYGQVAEIASLRQ